MLFSHNPVVFEVATGGGTSPGTGNLVSWYDFNNNGGNGTLDGQGSFNLTEVGGPTYFTASSPEYGIGASTGNARWTQTSLDSSWGNVSGDLWYVIRFQALSGISNNDSFFDINNSRNRIRWAPTAGVLRVTVGDVNVNVTVTTTEGVWFHAIGQMDTSAGEVTAFIDNDGGTTNTGTDAYGTGNATFGGDNGTGIDCQIDYMGLFTGLPTADNREWLYNSGGTREYSEL